MRSFCPGKEDRKLKRRAWRPVPTRPPAHSLRPSLRAPQSGSQWTWASRSRQKAQLCHQGDAKGLRFWATSACADIRGMKGTQGGCLWADVSRWERSRDATLDPALRKVRVTFAGRAWRLQALELRTKRRAAGLEAPRNPSPELDPRAPAAKTGSGHHRRAHPRDGWPSKCPRHVTTPLRQHTLSKRGGAGGGRGGRGAGRAGHAHRPAAGASSRAAPPRGGGHPAFNHISNLIITRDRAY